MMYLCCNCYHLSSSTSEKLVFLFLGAILGLIISLIWKNISDWWFGIYNLKPWVGEYKITLKNGEKYLDFNRACVEKVNGRKMTVIVELKNDIAKGEIDFISKTYGRGYYKHVDSDLYGFYEFILIPGEKICVLRKYTTDKNTKKRNGHEVVETSFIWEKHKSKCDL